MNPPHPEAGVSPAFSIIVPVFAPPAQLASCLEALRALQEPAGGFEVIIVDDGNPPGLEMCVDSYRRRLDVAFIRRANGGPAAARNTGVAVARGTYLAFVDVDCSPAPDWLIQLERGFAETPDAMLGGCTVNALQDNPYSTASQLIIDIVYAFFNPDPENAVFCASNNLALPMAMYRALGGFDERRFPLASEDRDFCDRWRLAGHRLRYLAGARVYHAHAMNLVSFWKQHFAYGRGAWSYQRARKERASGMFRADAALHSRFPYLLRRRLTTVPQRPSASVFALLAVWQLANAAGFAREALAKRRS